MNVNLLYTIDLANLKLKIALQGIGIDDAKVLDARAPITGVYSNGKRFGVDLPIRDRSGIAIGTMNVGYAYGGAKDAKALVAHAVALRDELQASIAATPALEEIDP